MYEKRGHRGATARSSKWLLRPFDDSPQIVNQVVRQQCMCVYGTACGNGVSCDERPQTRR